MKIKVSDSLNPKSRSILNKIPMDNHPTEIFHRWVLMKIKFSFPTSQKNNSGEVKDHPTDTVFVVLPMKN